MCVERAKPVEMRIGARGLEQLEAHVTCSPELPVRDTVEIIDQTLAAGGLVRYGRGTIRRSGEVSAGAGRACEACSQRPAERPSARAGATRRPSIVSSAFLPRTPSSPPLALSVTSFSLSLLAHPPPPFLLAHRTQ